MTNTKCTPGPWWRDDDGFVAAGAGDSYVTIADPNCTLDLSIDEREANARLIAAAPELLEVLAAIVSAADSNPHCSIGHVIEHGSGRYARAIVQKARAA